jgi:hypothetical protein
VVISERPAEVADRAVPGHWEGDMIIGLERSAIGTLVERTTRFTMLIHLPREEGYRHKQSVKNGPALAGYGAITMKNALVASITTLPEQLRRSLTWDRGKEMSAHAQFKIETGVPVYFADPHSPWQRGTNENTATPILPKGTDLARWSAEELEAVAATLNNRPRKTLGGSLRPKLSTSYCHRYNPVLQRSIESGQYTGAMAHRRTRRDRHPGSRDRHPGMGRLFNHRRIYEHCSDLPPSRTGSRALPSPRDPANG